MDIDGVLLYKDMQLYLHLSVFLIHVGTVHRTKAVLGKAM